MQKDGTSVHLEPKVMQVLVLLASHQGEVISKERLLQTVWSGVFVGEDVLTRSISEIRRMLADDARAPHVIQTIPKTGYRLIAPVSFAPTVDLAVSKELAVGQAALIVAASIPESAKAPIIGHPPTEATISGNSPATDQRLLLVSILIMCTLLGGTLFLFFRPKPRSKNFRAAYRTVPFTSYPGSEGQATFSPDGNQIAFVWNGRNAESKNIYVKIIGTSSPLRLTSESGDNADFSPTWSPDGRFIAFVRHSRTQSSIDIVSAIGGAERQVHTLSDPSWEYGGLAWSGDGKYLIFPDRLSVQEPSALFSLSLDTLEAKRLTAPAQSWDGDWTPVVSPDGRKIAFVRDPGSAARDVYVMDASGGVPKRLTNDGRQILGLTWTKDGRDVVFSSNRDGGFSLWEVPVSGGTPEHLGVGGENAYSPAISHHGNLLAYSHGTGKWDIVRVDLRSSERKVLTDQILSSNEQDSAPQFSPDGGRIAFQSWRSGTQEIWICSADGLGPAQLTSFGGALTGSPHWSPDGHWIAFDSRPTGRAHIYITNPDGGVPKPLTSGEYNDIVPSWSPDGKWVIFGSNRSGNWEIWKAPTGGGPAQQVTARGGMIALASPDGRWIYYTKPEMAGLWRISTTGGAEQQVLKDPPNGFQGYWGITKNGIYYLDVNSDRNSIDFVRFANPDHVARIHLLDHAPSPLSGLSISPDGHWLIYADMSEANSNITLVENFH